jgi:uncharacterized protein YcaQ
VEKNGRDRLQMKIWRMRIACLIPKAKETHSEYVIPIFFAAKLFCRKRLNIALYVQSLLLTVDSLSLHAIQYQPSSRTRNCSEFL